MSRSLEHLVRTGPPSRSAGTIGLLLSTAAVALAGAASPPEQASLEEFPPPPPPSERVARNEAERRSGAVILEDVTELTGRFPSTSFGTFGGNEGWSRKSRRVRYLVLDASGAERLTRHALFGETAEGLADVRGRTITPDGHVVPLDPRRDVRSLELKDARGRVTATVQSAFFPRVEPGAVLDLAWTENRDWMPELDVVPLQAQFPIRRLRVTSQGMVVDSNLGKAIFLEGTVADYCRVPFFLGPVPPRTRARLDGRFDLELEIEDVAPAVAEPFAPPARRTAYTLGLRVRPIEFGKVAGGHDWRRNLVLFGSTDTLPRERQAVERELVPAEALVQLDDRGLQPPPSWQSSRLLMSASHDAFEAFEDRLEDFFQRARGAEDERAVAAIAPPELPWRERARRLFDHARSRVKPDPGAEPRKTLGRVLKLGRGGAMDLAPYLSFLLERAGIPARLVLVTSRYEAPFMPAPFVPLVATGTTLMVEAGPPGEAPLYLSPGDPFATSSTLSANRLGALAFRQPERVSSSWPLFQIPLDQPISRRTRLALAAPLAAEGEEVVLTLESALDEAAAHDFRWALGFPGSSAEQRRAVMAAWLERWTGLELTGEPPDYDPGMPAGPFTFVLESPWRPEVQRFGDRLLVPALPEAELLRNPFLQESRQQPIWLVGGRYEVSMAWELPPGAVAGPLPAAAAGNGPGGLAYVLEVVAEPPAAAGSEGRIVTRLQLDLPYVLPAVDYAGVKRFFEELERAAETRLLIGAGG